jgi:lipoprotein-anchoring transpeptidase ErfK/SrfK
MRRVLFALLILTGALASSPGSADAAREAWSVVVVDLSEQSVRVVGSRGTTLRRWAASTGAPATPTPVGRFSVTTKSSSTFVTGSPHVTMSHMTRFRGGVGFHGIPRDHGKPMRTPLGVRGVSHGCVRLADSHAKELFQRLPIGAVVIVQI